VHDIPLKPSHRSYQTLVDVENGLAQFADAPVLLVWGMKDWCFTPNFYNEFRRHFPQAHTVEIPDGGHYIFEDAPKELLNCARDFLGHTSTPPSSPAKSASETTTSESPSSDDAPTLPSSDSPTAS